MLNLSKLKSFTSVDLPDLAEMVIGFHETVEYLVGKGENAGLVRAVFSVFQNLHCVVNG